MLTFLFQLQQLTYLSESSKESVVDPAMRSKSELMSPQEMHDRLVKLMSTMGFDEVSNYIDVSRLLFNHRFNL
jgi:hypothetical protein